MTKSLARFVAIIAVIVFVTAFSYVGCGKKSTSGSSAPVAIKLVFTTQPASSVTVDGKIAFTVTVQDANGMTITSATNLITISSGGLTGLTIGNPKTKAAVAGVATFTDITVGGLARTGYKLYASATGLTGANSDAFELIGFGAKSKLVFTGQPTNTVVDGTMLPITVTVQDTYGNKVITATDSITITNTGLTLANNIVAAVAGAATFDAVTVGGLAGSWTLSASAAGFANSTSVAFALTGFATANKLGFITQPSETIAGAVFSPVVVVAAQDKYGNTVTDYSAPDVTITGVGTTLVGTITLTPLSGVVTFSDVTVGTVIATGCAISATSGVLTGISTTFNVTPATAYQLAFTTQPVDTAVDTVATSFAVTVQDIYGNKVTNANNTITIVRTGLILGGIKIKAAVNGVATFDAVTIGGLAGSWFLGATAAGLTPATSDTFTLSGFGAENRLAFTTQPTTIGVDVATTFEVTVQDIYGNPVITATNTITLTAGTDILAIGGTISKPVVAGVATFDDITVGGVSGIGKILIASSPNLTGATSAAFALTGFGTKSKLRWVIQPATLQEVGVAWATFTIEITDIYGNRDTTADDDVTVVKASGTGTLSGTLTGVTDSGLVTFSLVNTTVGGTMTIEGTSSTLTKTPASGSIVINY